VHYNAWSSFQTLYDRSVKILKKSASFKAVRYNTGKVEKEEGELLLAQNFGVLRRLEDLRPP
jgi:hypothetical protein